MNAPTSSLTPAPDTLLTRLRAEVRFIVRRARLARALTWWAAALCVLSFWHVGLFALLSPPDWRPGPAAYDVVVLTSACTFLVLAPVLESRLGRPARGGRAGRVRTGASADPEPAGVSGVVAVLARLVAVLPFVAVAALPLLVIGLVLQGASPWAVPVHLLLLALIAWVACAMTWAARACTQRRWVAVAAVYALCVFAAVGPPVGVVGLGTVVTVEQEQTVYANGRTSSSYQCPEEPEVRTETVARSELYWWLLVADPFAALADASARGPHVEIGQEVPPWLGMSLQTLLGLMVDNLRDPHPPEVELWLCDDAVDSWDDAMDSWIVEEQAQHAPFWPASALVMVVLAAMSSAVGSLVLSARGRGRGYR